MAKKAASKNSANGAKKTSGASKPKKTADTVDEELSPRHFLEQQVEALSASLEAPDARDLPYNEEQGDRQLLQDTVNKAVAAIDKGLRDARERKLNGVAIQAIAEQVEYLHVLQGAKAASAKNGSEVFQEDVTVRVDREDWLIELPAKWPGGDDASGADLLETYMTLLANVRSLAQRQRYLQQQTAHYDDLLLLAEKQVDLDAVQGALAPPKQKSTKRKAG